MENTATVSPYSAMLKATRDMTNFYLSKTDGINPKHRFIVNGQELNSLYWIVGHMAWAEKYLLIDGTAGPDPELLWLNFFSISRPHDDSSGGPSWKEVQQGFGRVHKIASNHIASLSEEQLDSDNYLGRKIMGGMAQRNCIMHHLRHEAIHCGHISWLLKMHGVKTI